MKSLTPMMNPDGSVQNDVAYIEVKKRIGSQRRKKRFKSPFPASQIMNMNLKASKLMWVGSFLLANGVFIGHHIFPVVIVRYERYRFIEPRSNITASMF